MRLLGYLIVAVSILIALLGAVDLDVRGRAYLAEVGLQGFFLADGNVWANQPNHRGVPFQNLVLVCLAGVFVGTGFMIFGKKRG